MPPNNIHRITLTYLSYLSHPDHLLGPLVPCQAASRALSIINENTGHPASFHRLRTHHHSRTVFTLLLTLTSAYLSTTRSQQQRTLCIPSSHWLNWSNTITVPVSLTQFHTDDLKASDGTGMTLSIAFTYGCRGLKLMMYWDVMQCLTAVLHQRHRDLYPYTSLRFFMPVVVYAASHIPVFVGSGILSCVSPDGSTDESPLPWVNVGNRRWRPGPSPGRLDCREDEKMKSEWAEDEEMAVPWRLSK